MGAPTLPLSAVMDAPGSDPVLNEPLNSPLHDAFNDALIARLASESREFDASSRDPERNCWLAVHRHVHGVLPSEYDIREVPEELYLAVLAARREQG
jgi:hypothetical protein